MIEYVEIRDAETRNIGIIDTATSVIWHSVFFGVGDFEIYVAAKPEIVALLLTGQYVTRPDNKEVGIIEKIEIQTDEEGARMILASGRFAKSILDRRLIYKLNGSTNTPTILRGNIETAVRAVVANNAITCEFDNKRNIDILALGEIANIPLRITDANGKAAQKQVSYENLLEYTDALLAEYGIGATCILKDGKFRYIMAQGKDRSKDNADGNAPIVFSEEFDNLISSNYAHDTTNAKNAALIGGEGEGVQRYYAILETSVAGLQRREIWVDASSISRTYKDDSDTEQTYTDEEYKTMLEAKGKQDIAPLVDTETFDGVIDATNGNYIYGRDFALGDIVTVQDKEIGKYINVRIREATEIQDADGYSVEVIYQ